MPHSASSPASSSSPASPDPAGPGAPSGGASAHAGSPQSGGRRHRRDLPRTPRALRILLPALLIVGWLALAGVGGPYFGRVDEVSSNDRTAYLPESSEATRVAQLAPEFTGSDAIPAIIVITSPTAIDAESSAAIEQATADLAQLEQVRGDISPPITSEDGLAVQVFVPLDAETDLAEATTAIRAELEADLPPGLTGYVTGPAGFSADLAEAFAGIDGLLLGVALAAVLLILVVVYRSLLLPAVVLATSMSALCAALLLIWHLAAADVLLLSGQTQGILFILVIGAATDYSLLYVARYRDELRRTASRWTATTRALRGTIEPVLASGGTVIAGLLCLLLSDLRSNSSLGPVAAVGILFAMAAALTFLPAALLLLGRTAFWPRRPRLETGADGGAETGTSGHGVWERIARAVRRRPRPVWVLTALVLAVGGIGLVQLEADGVPQSDLVLGESAAREGQAVLGEHFPAGAGSPVQVLVPEADLEATAELLLAADGIDSVAVTAADSPSGSAPVTADGIQPLGPPGSPAPEPTVVDGQVLLQATLSSAPDSLAAEETVRELRGELAAQDLPALVGGSTATALDTDETSVHDRALIIPIVLVVITVILMLLLRAILAPLLLIATTVLSFATALGISAIVFEHVFRFPGADPAVPLYGFVFLVALGIDYNIFLMTRVREESLRHGTRDGVVRGLAVTGGVITSAGLVLAATFAALGVIPILFLAQIAFIVALGVLLDTFVVRTLLVPALALDLGRVIWWPSALWRRGKP
ncbi:MMPL family transporter [Brachybacterium aquaticum]|uniref:RND superfamily putative drug exporter n=1 Tax=Brachybacterium aquaticum TaxID=1432564 RepID=A0A841A968_9MICO|nr:MMPL family transporter [Brachybacterium aquaticum]MBB5830487.1 RND superfamily putative drug exporter [Brachybacterium aquaticum]